MSERFVVEQEADEIAKRKLVVVTTSSIVIFTLAVVVAAWLLAVAEQGRDTGPKTAAVAPTTINSLEQGLILGPPRGLDEQRRQRATLERWGWVDRDAGIARIPVERAMDLIVREVREAGDGGAP